MCLNCGTTSEVAWFGVESLSGEHVGVICESCWEKILALPDPYERDAKFDALEKKAQS